MPLLRRGIDAIGRVLGPALSVVHRLRDAAPILLYHRVSPDIDPAYQPLHPDVFREHCIVLRTHFDVLPLTELMDRATSGRSLRRQCAITVDDGYADFREHTLPVLREFAHPVTLFAVVDCLTGRMPPWTYRYNRMRLGGQAQPSEFQSLGALIASEREARIGTTSSATPMPAMLSVEDLAALRFDPLVTIGSHTCSHGFLPWLPEDEARREIATSKTMLESAIGCPVEFLAYPNGYHSPAVDRHVRDAGYRAGLAVGQSFVSAASPAFGLPRFDVGSLPAGMFALEITGAVERIRRMRA